MAQSDDKLSPKANPDAPRGPASDPLDELARLMGAAGLEPPQGYQRSGEREKPLHAEGLLPPRVAEAQRAMTDDQLIDDALADGDLLSSELDLSDFELQPGSLDADLSETDDLLADLNFSDLLSSTSEGDSTVTTDPTSDPLPPMPEAAAVPQVTAAELATDPTPETEPAPEPVAEPAPAAQSVQSAPEPDLDEDALLAAMDDFSLEDELAAAVEQQPVQDQPVASNVAAGAIAGVAASVAATSVVQPVAKSVEKSIPTGLEADVRTVANDPDLDPGAPPLAPVSADLPARATQDDAPLEEYDQPQPRARRSSVFMLVAPIILVLGGVVAYGFMSGSSDDTDAPQLIAADDSAIKVEQTPDTSEQPAQPGDAVFSALDDDAEPNADAASGADDELPRIVLPAPGAESINSQVTPVGPAEDIAPAAPGSTASRPVRTVTVLADGTVVDVVEEATDTVANAVDTAVEAGVDAAQGAVEGVADVTEDVAAAVETLATEVTSEVVSTRPVETIAVGPNSGPALNPDTLQQITPQQVAPQADPTELAVLDLGPPAGGTPSIRPPAPTPRPAALQPVTPALTVIETAAAPAQTPIPTPAPTVSSPVQLPAPAQVPTQAASNDPSAVVPPAETATTTPTQPAAAPAPTGDWVVQLASLRSQSQAASTFTELQGRFGSILGGYSPDIQQVNLGDRGIFHRLRIGPMDRATATSLCERYQSAGGDCFVQRR